MTLIETLDRVSHALDRKNTTIGVFIDLSKAFDTSNHNILSKLHHYGIRGLAYDWFKNDLSNRLQYVKVGSIENPNGKSSVHVHCSVHREAKRQVVGSRSLLGPSGTIFHSQFVTLIPSVRLKSHLKTHLSRQNSG